jgi:hypothetical protein
MGRLGVSYQLSFARQVAYDAGQAGLTLTTTLWRSGARITCEAKVDTGATYCIFARRHGEALGLIIESSIPQRIATVQSSFTVYLREVNLAVAGLELTALVGFAAEENLPRNVLGRRGFLEQVMMGLVDYEGRLYLSPYGAD